MAEILDLKKAGKAPKVFDMTSRECIWSAAGVAPFRLCSGAFDCMSCAFDLAMQKKREEGRCGWRPAKDSESALADKRCRHMVSGYVSSKYCSRNFECASCSFDQLVEDEMRSLEPAEPMVELISGFALAPRHYYLSGHTWARLEYGGQLRVGLDDFAARLLGPADGWMLPALGTAVCQGAPEVVLRREGRAAHLLCPVHGVVVAVNQRLGEEPRLANHSPYGSGWLMIVQPSRPRTGLRGLLFGRQAEAWLEQEAERLDQLLYRDAALRPAAIGGRRLADIYGQVAGLDWDELVLGFLAGRS